LLVINGFNHKTFFTKFNFVALYGGYLSGWSIQVARLMMLLQSSGMGFK